MIHTGDCLSVMAGMADASVDAVVTDPPYGLEFMGKGWDKFAAHGFTDGADRRDGPSWHGGDWANKRCVKCGHIASGGSPCQCPDPEWVIERGVSTAKSAAYGEWCEAWGREALRVTVPGGYLLAFGGTRTHHRLVCGLEDAGWIIRDELDWIYASGFPKGRANLKPAHEPIVLARKPGPLRMLNIDGCRIPGGGESGWHGYEGEKFPGAAYANRATAGSGTGDINASGRWPANLLLTDPVFDGGVDGVVGGGEARGSKPFDWTAAAERASFPVGRAASVFYDDEGTYSRFFLIPKADRADREPLLRADTEPYEHSGPRGHLLNGDGTARAPSRPRANVHPTVKPIELMRHLVRLVTPPGGMVLDPFLGSGTTAIACEMEGFAWIGIEKEAEYVAIAEARLNGVQKGMGLTG